MLTLYGSPQSRASRCIWMLEELATDYELIPVSDTKSKEYLTINPNGKVPCLRDGPVTIWESMAINLYLAETVGSSLSHRNNHELGDLLKWTLWSQSELEEHFNHIASPDEITPEWMSQTFGVLEATLANQPYLVGDRFTVADLNVCTMFWGPVSSVIDLTDFPKANAWRKRNYEREAAQTTINALRGQ